jgi:hypothetical protein
VSIFARGRGAAAFSSPHGAVLPRRISQISLEPVPAEAAARAPQIELRFGWRVERVEADACGATLGARELASDASSRAARASRRRRGASRSNYSRCRIPACASCAARRRCGCDRTSTWPGAATRFPRIHSR